MAVKLHRCSIMFVKGPHPCWKVQKALDDAGVPYEVVKHHPLRFKRPEWVEQSGQNLLPALELENGDVLREESKDLAARIGAGNLPG